MESNNLDKLAIEFAIRPSEFDEFRRATAAVTEATKTAYVVIEKLLSELKEEGTTDSDLTRLRCAAYPEIKAAYISGLD